GGVYRTYTKEIKLDAGGNDTSEWKKTYTDGLGRAYKTAFSDNAFTQSAFNNKGQLTAQIDPDSVVTLFAYNAKGELQDSAIDMNRNGIIDYNSSDRITRTITDVVSDHGTAVRR